MPLILGTNSIKDTGYDVANSLRFNDGSTDYLSISGSTPDNRKKFTYSFWFKRSHLGTDQALLSYESDSNNRGQIQINSSDQLRYFERSGGSTTTDLVTNRLFRDVSSWYSIIISVDTSQGTDTNRVKIYVNGVQETSFATSTYPSQNYDTNANGTFAKNIGRRNVNGDYKLDGYLTEVVFVDGTVTAHTDYGEFDEDSGIWKPIDVSGLTFGNNGFYLDFEDSSALGNDVSGNDNDFTANNLTAIDQSTDTCTNNFATMNPLDNYYQSATFSEGNLKIVTAGSTYTYNSSTFALSSGKWYCEIKVVSTDTNGRIGVAGILSTASSNEFGNGIYHWGYVSGTGQIENNNTHTSYGSSYTNGDIIGIYLDLDNNKLYFAKNGTIQNSGTGINITDSTNVTDGVYYIGVGETSGANSLTAEINFGNPTFSISSGNTDPDGYGNFEYSTNDGGSASFDSSAKDFYALNTKNLAEYG